MCVLLHSAHSNKCLSLTWLSKLMYSSEPMWMEIHVWMEAAV
uniref:Uncharacterized protein n=1 Tax=Anguilla anguilla TaxID=7936 RepID=A0A0E9U967_ANGAN